MFKRGKSKTRYECTGYKCNSKAPKNGGFFAGKKLSPLKIFMFVHLLISGICGLHDICLSLQISKRTGQRLSDFVCTTIKRINDVRVTEQAGTLGSSGTFLHGKTYVVWDETLSGNRRKYGVGRGLKNNCGGC